MVKWLHEHGYSFSVWMMNIAAARGSLAVLQFLHDQGFEGCTADAMGLTVRYGHLEVVDFPTRIASKASETAQNGSLETVIFLLENRREGCRGTKTRNG